MAYSLRKRQNAVRPVQGNRERLADGERDGAPVIQECDQGRGGRGAVVEDGVSERTDRLSRSTARPRRGARQDELERAGSDRASRERGGVATGRVPVRRRMRGFVREVGVVLHGGPPPCPD